MGKLKNELVRFHLNALNNTCLCVVGGDNALAADATEVFVILPLYKFVTKKKIPSVFQ
jgi:hypothetical protein